MLIMLLLAALPVASPRRLNDANVQRCPAPDSFGRVCIQYLNQCISNADCESGCLCCLVAGCGTECINLQNPTSLSEIPRKTEPEAVGAKTVSALRGFTALTLSKMSLGDIARIMVDEVDFMKDTMGSLFDRPIRDMMNDLMESKPDDILHAMLDPIMNSPRSQETMEELDRQLADFIQKDVGDVPLDDVDILGSKSLSAIFDYALEVLPRISGVQIAGQIMLQFQVQFAPMMDTMKNTTIREITEPIMNFMAKIPDSTPSEAVHMIAEPIMNNLDQMPLGKLDEKTAEFVQQSQRLTYTITYYLLLFFPPWWFDVS